MAPRANWKGYLKVGELSCPVSLFTAASTSERVAFHTLSRKTGRRVHRQFVDSVTGKPVEAADQVKGYQTGQDEYVVLELEEIAAAIPESDKTLSILAFVACGAIDDVYFDRPYYLAPGNAAAVQAYATLREGMRAKKVAAIASAMLFRRMRAVLVRADQNGLIATTLNFDYEIRSAKEAFEDIPKLKLGAEMMDLAKHIIKTKAGKFDVKAFDDRYEAAIVDLVRAKVEGKPLKKRAPVAAGKVVDLMEALRQSAGARGGAKKAKTAARSTKGAAKSPRAGHPRRKAS
jgi:DNA end-binding protein Ku